MTQLVPKVGFAHIGGSGTWACSFPEDAGLGVVTAVEDQLHFDTPFGRSPAFKLIRLQTPEGEEREFLDVRMHGWTSTDHLERMRGAEQMFWVFQQAGVKKILAEGSVGSLNPLLEPWDMVIPSDYIDLKKVTSSAFIGDHLLRMAQPVCPDLAQILYEETIREGFTRVFHRGVCGVPPGSARFETAAEFLALRSWHVDYVNHSMAPEVYFARAIGACYAPVYVVTNPVEGLGEYEMQDIAEIYNTCGPRFSRIILRAMERVTETDTCGCATYRSPSLKSITSRIYK